MMKNIIAGEFFKIKCNKKNWIINCIIIFAVIIYCTYLILLNISISEFINNELVTIVRLFLMSAILLNYIYQEEYHHKTMKNLMSIIRSRRVIFSGKLLVQVVLASCTYFFIIIILFVSTMLMKNDSKSISLILQNMSIVLLVIYFTLLRSLALLDLFTVLCKNDYITFTLYWFSMNCGGHLLNFVLRNKQIPNISMYTIQGQINSIPYNNIQVLNSIIINIAVFIVYIFIAEIVFNKCCDKL